MCMHTGREGRAMTGLYGQESSPSGEPGRGSGVLLTRHSLPLPSIHTVDMQKQSAHLWWTGKKPTLSQAKRVQVGKEERRSSDEKTDSSDELSVFERSGLSSDVARRKGFEPLTFWSVARRSIQLS